MGRYKIPFDDISTRIAKTLLISSQWIELWADDKLKEHNSLKKGSQTNRPDKNNYTGIKKRHFPQNRIFH